MTHAEVRALMLSFPGVEDGFSYGEPSFKVAGKFLTWLRPGWTTASWCIWTTATNATC
ncbi:hypothetical protein [Brevundimonas sp.]|jgi:hypothetical protein|uniref:hypothetical protein n=1 Tax=Brevundimonas sp. TaxID=1871086 RepID=UPI0028AAE669|nr:hypothetical protein [Brevundimonas sp.]